MSFTDPIGDMLTRIRNGLKADQDVVELPHSRLKAEIAMILKREGYLRDVQERPGTTPQKVLRLELKYGPDREPVIQGVARQSRPGLRKYAGTASLPRVLGGLGIAIISTSNGLMTDREARRRKLGGEVLCTVW